MGITCKPWGNMKGRFAKLQRELDTAKKLEKKAMAKESKKATN